MSDELYHARGVHMFHCGPFNDGGCKYGDPDCPACVTDTKPSDVDGLIEAMRDDPYMDDAHLLGTTTQDARMTHYAEIAAAHFSTTLAAQQAELKTVLDREAATIARYDAKLDERDARIEAQREAITQALIGLNYIFESADDQWASDMARAAHDELAAALKEPS